MSRRPVPNAGTAVSLFPFLAVLLCTIGSLLLLLVVIARQSRSDAEQAIAQAKAKPAVDMAEVERQREDLDWQVEQLNASRDRTVEVLAQQRSHLSHLEEHSQRLRAEIKEWENAERQLAERTTLDAAAQERLKAELAELQKLKAEAEAKLTDVKGRVKRTAFAVVPYEGSNGTKRRPIYIECRGDSITIQPEGIVFTEADFGGSLGPSNPLAACVRATAEHYARIGSLEPGEQPYPLLLVRPDGVMAYYVARAAMSSWDSEFGYELVDAEWELDYPRVDPQLQKLLAATQIEARRRQEMIARSAPPPMAKARMISPGSAAVESATAALPRDATAAMDWGATDKVSTDRAWPHRTFLRAATSPSRASSVCRSVRAACREATAKGSGSAACRAERAAAWPVNRMAPPALPAAVPSAATVSRGNTAEAHKVRNFSPPAA